MALAWLVMALGAGMQSAGAVNLQGDRTPTFSEPSPTVVALSQLVGTYKLGEGTAGGIGSRLIESLLLHGDHSFVFQDHSCMGFKLQGTWSLDGEEIVLTGENPWEDKRVCEILRLVPAHMADRLYLVKDFDFPRFCANKRAVEAGVNGLLKNYMGLQRSYPSNPIKPLSDSWLKREALLPIGRVAAVSCKGWVVEGVPSGSVSVGDLLGTQAKSGGQLRALSVHGDQVICEVMPSEDGWIPTLGEVVYAEKMLSSTEGS